MVDSGVRLLAAELEEGENAYTDCPSCGKKNKLSILRENGRALYHCFSASCDLHGGGAFALNGGRLVRTRSAPRKQKVTPYTGELTYLDGEWAEYLRRKIGWTDWHFDTGRPMFALDEHRVAYPIFSPLGRRRGWSLRSYNSDEPKSLTRMDVAEPHISWYVTYPATNTVLVVEDIPSAVRAAKYTNALALCGTGCGPDYAGEIAAHVRNVVWALDADATKQAIRLQRQYGLMFDSSSVLTIDEDLKDMEEDKLCAIFSQQ